MGRDYIVGLHTKDEFEISSPSLDCQQALSLLVTMNSAAQRQPLCRGVSRIRCHAAAVSPAAVAQPPASASGHRAFNFSAGPAILPLDVLEIAQADMLSWHGSGMSVMEMSHRGPEFLAIIQKAEKDLRTLMNVPDNYKARWRAELKRTWLPAAVQRCARCRQQLQRQGWCWLTA